MKEYIATFHTHLSALLTSRKLTSLSVRTQMMPVPRKLSSSCGTCVKFSLDSDIEEFVQSGIFDEDVDTVYRVEEDSYTPVHENHIR